MQAISPILVFFGILLPETYSENIQLKECLWRDESCEKLCEQEAI